MKISPNFRNPLDNGKALRDLCFEAHQRPGGELWIERGWYDIGGTLGLRIPQHTLVHSNGATLLSQLDYVANGARLNGFNPQRTGCSFELSDGSILDGLNLRYNGPLGGQGVLVGYGWDDGEPKSTVSAAPRSAEIRYCNLDSSCFAIYLWLSETPGCRLWAHDLNITSGRQCVTLGGSSGPDAQFVDLERLKLVVRPEKCTRAGAVSEPNYGGALAVTIRGGYLRMADCFVDAFGGPPAKVGPRCCAVTNWYDGGTDKSRMEIIRLTSRLVANGAKQLFDVDARNGWARVEGGLGSGDGGGLSVYDPNQSVQRV